MRVVAEAIGCTGKTGDDLAEDLDVDPAQLSRALHGKATFSLKWLPLILYRDRSHTLVRYLCSVAGGDFVPRPKMTPEQRVERLERALRDAGVFGEAVIRAAYGEEA